MKLAQLSGATVLRPDITVKKKKSAPSGCPGPRVNPVVKLPHGNVFLLVNGQEIPVVEVNFHGAEGLPPQRRSYLGTLYRTPMGMLYLVRDSWPGRMGDAGRRRHAYTVRRIGAVGALLWMLGSVYDDHPEHLKRERAKMARVFWKAIHGKGGIQ